jgi:hypothetical protein
METTTTIIQRKRKADHRDEQTSSVTKSHHHHQHHHHHRLHLRIEAPKFIGVRDATTIMTTSLSSPSREDEEVHVALSSFAPPSPRPVTPREMMMQVDDYRPPPQGEGAGDGAASTTTTTAEGEGEGACLASLPVELFCNVVAYLGPTSSSLCDLCQISKYHNVVMTNIGDVMLHRARLRFRVPLPPRTAMAAGGAAIDEDDGGVRGAVATATTIVESSVSLFVRHARVSKAVHDRLGVLEGMMGRWRGPSSPHSSDASPADGRASASPAGRVPDRDRRRGDPAAPSARRRDGAPPTAAAAAGRPSEVRRALDVALCLLGVPDRDYFEDDPDLAHLIASQSSTTALERRVIAVCGSVGATSYKYAKSRMCRRYREGGEGGVVGVGMGERFLHAYHAVTDRMMLHDHHHHHRPALDEDDGDYGDDDDDVDDASVDASEMEADEDMMLLDKASLVMQHVFLREREMARRRAQFLLL